MTQPNINLDLSAVQHRIALAQAAAYTAMDAATVAPVDEDRPSRKQTAYAIVDLLQRIDDLTVEFKQLQERHGTR